MRNFVLYTILPFALQAAGEGATEEPLRQESALDTQVIPAVTTPRVTSAEEEATLIEGLTLVNGGVRPETVKSEHGIHIDLIGTDFAPLAKHLQRFINHPLTAESLQEIKDTITDYFLHEKKRYVAVVLPVQQVEDGVIVLQVFPGTLDQVQYTGQTWFNVSALERAFPFEKGDPIIETELLDYVTWVNRNPFHHMRVILEPGSSPGTTSLEFLSKDRFIVRPYLGADNTGFQINNQIRLYGGFTWGNTFMAGDLLSFQYTAAPNFHQLQSYVFSYTSFLSSERELTFFGCYGTVYPEVAPPFSVEGKNIQFSMRYQIPIRPFYGNFRSNGTIGFDYKYLTSAYFFAGSTAEVGIPTSSQIMNITQFYFDYDLLHRWGSHALTFKAQLYASLWKDLLSYQSVSAYDAQRPGSCVRYAYLNVALNERKQMPNNWVLSAMFRGQLASGALPTSEQFGLGGADTVRGYYEQQFVADNAICINLQCYTPPLSLFASSPNELVFVAFLDYGYGVNYAYSGPDFRHQQLVGIGPGVHYDIIPYVSAKAEYGFQLKAIPQDDRFGRFHLSLNVSY